MQRIHWLILAGLLASLASMIGSLDTWSEAAKPLFVGGLLGAIAAHLAALFTDNASGPGPNAVSAETLKKIVTPP